METIIEKSTTRSIRIWLIVFDIIALNFCSFFALWVRFDLTYASVPMHYWHDAMRYALPNTATMLVVFIFMRLYNRIWRYVGMSDFLDILAACGITAFLQFIGMHLLHLQVPRSFYPISFIAFVSCEIAIRFSYRVYRQLWYERHCPPKSARTNVMLIGAGEAGSIIIREMQSSAHLSKNVVCVIDDDPLKQGRYFHGCTVVGGRNSILEYVDKYSVDEIVIALPSATRKEVRKILNICNQTSCQLRILPGVYQLISGEVSVSKLREVQIEDLLGRDSVEVDLEKIMDYVHEKTILVTGGGGSIGSELCRQIAGYHPKKLIIFDIYENNAYAIQQELLVKYPYVNLEVLIGSVRDSKRMEEVFKKYKPEIVYHAAAHKHVPLMEDSPNEAIKNNVFGTYKTASMADKYGAEKFVLISTDKAVNPTNIMGASKRICEMIIQTLNKSSKTDFVAVRFGNVLGSNGSVIPLFKKQIEQGGPVTVTHPDIIRYFMTIPEAVSLVLQAGSYAKGGEIFVLDMGEPMKIVDLAQNLIRLSGYKVDEDIEIVYTGLRPGEKLYEELLMSEEGMQETENKLIYIGKPIEFDEALFMKQLDELKKHMYLSQMEVISCVQKMVPSYTHTINQKRQETANYE